MKIALIGYGKMGCLIEELAVKAGHTITAIVDPNIALSKTDFPIYGSIVCLKEKKGDIDAAIEFTNPKTATENLFFLAKEKIPVVTGTTGWYDRLLEISSAVKETKSLLFWAPNFSFGMNLFYRLAGFASELFDPFVEYDAGGYEIHHNKKADSPSGTAKAIAEIMLSAMKRKKKVVYETPERPLAQDELHFASLRAGSVPGIHSVLFDSEADSIELTHTLRNRNGLASGALRAAEWLNAASQNGKSGVFTMDDMLSDILERRINK